MTEIQLGNTVKDPISGFVGIAITRSDMMNGNVQYGLQPPGAPDKLSDANYIDHHLLEVIDEGYAGKLPPVASTMGIEFGDEVCEDQSGLTGIVIEQITFMNGCIYFLVQPPLNKKDGTKPKAELIMAPKLTIITKAKAPLKVAPTKDKTKKVAARPPGGPTRSAREFAIR
jgi:hypothetical protein